MISRIANHNGQFHADEVLALSLLSYLPRFKNAEIVRTRDPKLLSECDVCVDVGGVYDPSLLRFDYH